MVDDIDPEFSSVPADITVECDVDTTNTANTGGSALATDNCDTGVTITYSDSTVNGTGNNSVITRTWTATDDSGNVSTEDQVITVEDTTNPTFTTSPADITIECDDNVDDLTLTGAAEATDNCDTDVTITYSD